MIFFRLSLIPNRVPRGFYPKVLVLARRERGWTDHVVEREEDVAIAHDDVARVVALRAHCKYPWLPICMRKQGTTTRVLEYARLAMGFAYVRAGTRVPIRTRRT